MLRVLFFCIIIIMSSCISRKDLCSNYISNNTVRQEKLYINHIDNSFDLLIDSNSDIIRLSGQVKFIKRNKIELERATHFVTIEDNLQVSEDEIQIVVSVIDTFLIRGKSNKFYPMNIFMDGLKVGEVDLMKKSDTISINNFMDTSIIQINDIDDPFYYSVKLPIQNHKGKVVHLDILRKSNLNSDYMKRRIKKGYLLSLSGTKFQCVNK